MIKSHILGYPRIGAQRELKWALEQFWSGQCSEHDLLTTGRQLCEQNWQQQIESGLDFITVGDFSFYDHMLDLSVLLSVIPERFQGCQGWQQYFAMARGTTLGKQVIAAQSMTKWFNTNYHYLVPELAEQQAFALNTAAPLWQQLEWAKALNYPIKVVIPGPLTFLQLSRVQGEASSWTLVDALLPVYQQLLQQLAQQGVEWVQLDEPILATDLTIQQKNTFESVYTRFNARSVKLLLASYFGSVADNAELLCRLPVDALHIDVVHGAEQLASVLDKLPSYRILSLGVINGRNIWAADLQQAVALVQQVQQRRGDQLWLAPSCSLLHVPVDLASEQQLDPQLKSWLAFAQQKLTELQVIKAAVQLPGSQQATLQANQQCLQARQQSSLVLNPAVQQRLQPLGEQIPFRQTPYAQRKALQQEALNLPPLATTTIGSLPQTREIRALRRQLKQGTLTTSDYTQQVQQHIAKAVQWQSEIGLDVLVHGEFERNDMVEYFGEQLDGFAFTDFGWVQSYGSRCVKPPVIYGDVSRRGDMTVAWTRYAQSLTDKVMKGMLTGPVTILCWSFVREDQPLQQTCRQIALAIQDEVVALEHNGIQVIQIDEPAIREGLPLRKAQWQQYLDWAIGCFRLCSTTVKAQTQIHTHMCYSNFNDIIDAVAKLDADVVTIEASRSKMKLLQAFQQFQYPNDIGPGVYDIHSANVPSVDFMVENLHNALQYIQAEQLWVNPDCGLKTRDWPETEAALRNMVQAAQQVRQRLLTAA